MVVDNTAWKMTMKRRAKRSASTRRTFIGVLTVMLLARCPVSARLADRGRVVKARREKSHAAKTMNDRVRRAADGLAIEGPKYRVQKNYDAVRDYERRRYSEWVQKNKENESQAPWNFEDLVGEDSSGERRLSSQLTGCCSSYQGYSASQMCYSYGEDCSSGQEPSHDSGDGSCEMEGLSFIGVSFSVNTARGSPYSYQLCDQYPMENIIDRDYDYVMSMDEDGWLVGGGYKSFDYSGKMPYIDSSHTELLRIGSVDPNYGGTSIEQVYSAMASISFPPFSIFPEYVKGGGGHHSGDDEDGSSSVPSGDVTLIVSVVETYNENNNYSDYDTFLDSLFDAMYNVGGGPCMDDHDTDPHVSMARGVKFKSSYHEQQYFYKVNLEVAVWQALYPNGVVIGTSAKANFPPNNAAYNRQTVGYGNLYFFFDRANITKAFPPNRDLSSTEEYYATAFEDGLMDSYYSSVNSINFDYSGSGDNDDQNYEHNPYSWNAKMAKHDMTDGWDLPPNCEQEGETFFGIPMSRSSGSKLQSTSSFQEQFDFEVLLDRNFTYVAKFGTNHGWLIGEILNNGPASIVDKDTAHIPIFYTGTTNTRMGGMSLSDMIKVAKEVDFGTLYIKPAFVFQDDDASLKIQFEADADSALGYLYDNLCKMIGLSWNYESPSNNLGVYTNCAMHAAGDRAKYGCGPDNANSGGFCPQLTLAYRVGFQSEDAAAAYMTMANNYVDYWRSLYPSGVAVGTSSFCPNGGCLGLFLNRYDLFTVFRPDLGGSWVEFNGGSAAPTISPAPTYDGGCDNPRNKHLDACFIRDHGPRRSAKAWESLGAVGQLSIFLIAFMATTLSISVFLARARRRRKKGETYLDFFIRDVTRRRKKKKKLRKKNRGDLEQDILQSDMFNDDVNDAPPPPPRSGRGRSRSRSKSRTRTSSKARLSRDYNPSLTEVPYEEPKRYDHDPKYDESSRSRSSRSRSKSRTRSSSKDPKRGASELERVQSSRRQLV